MENFHQFSPLIIWMDNFHHSFTIFSPCGSFIFGSLVCFGFSMFHPQKQISDLHRGQLRVITEAGSGRGVELWHQAAKNTDSYSHMKYVGYLWFMEHIYGTYIWNIYGKLAAALDHEFYDFPFSWEWNNHPN